MASQKKKKKEIDNPKSPKLRFKFVEHTLHTSSAPSLPSLPSLWLHFSPESSAYSRAWCCSRAVCDFSCNLPLKYADLIEFNCIWNERFPFAFFPPGCLANNTLYTSIMGRFQESNTQTENLFLCWWEKQNNLVYGIVMEKSTGICNKTLSS